MVSQWHCKMLKAEQFPCFAQRSVPVVLEDKNGAAIQLRNNVVLSDEISQPTLSFGRLTHAGWSICVQTIFFSMVLTRSHWISRATA